MKNLKPALYIVGAIIIAGIFFGGRFNPAPDPTTPPAPATTVTTGDNAPPPPTSTVTPTTTEALSTTPDEGTHQDTAQPVPTPSYDGGEDPNWKIPEGARQGAIAVTEAFITGWLTPEPRARRELLEPVAAQGLVDELTVANLRTWNATPASAPTIVEFAPVDAMARQTFTDGRSVDLLLAAEPDTTYGWIITDIQPSR